MKTLKRLVSSLLVFSMIASMFLTVNATENTSEPNTQSGQQADDYDIVDNIYIDGKLDMDIRAVSTVLSSSQSYSDVLGHNSRLDSVYFPSVIELQYQQNPSDNGKLIAATSIGETGRPDDVDPSLGALLESTDGGQSWNVIFRPVETAMPWFWAGQMAHIYELPAQVGDMPAGTIIYSANTVNYGDIDNGGTFKGYSHISAWRSLDAGKTWEQYTVVRSVTDGGLRLGVWEPVMFYDNGYLYCFYSDDSYGTDTLTGLNYGPDQKLVYQRTKDGVNWEAPVDVYSPTTLTDRPGMPVITKMGNGEYFLVYENGKVGGDCYIYYKKTNDITNWNPSDPGKLLTAKVSGKDYKMASSPCCVWSPAGGDCGTLLAMGRREFGGDGTIRMFASFDYGNTWTTIKNPLPYDWYTSASAGADGNDSIGYRPIMVLGADPSIIHYINITETDYVKGSQAKYAKLKIYDNDSPNEDKNIENYQKKIVFKVVNGRWNDGTTADKIVYATLSKNGVWNLGGSAALSVPAVGGKPNASFTAGSWDVTPPSTVSGIQTATYTYTYKFSAAKTLSVGSETINVGNIRTVLSHSAGPHFPSVIELKHQSDPKNNGKLIAAMSLFDELNETMACITQSTDGGKTWSVLSRPKETINPYVWGGNMAHIYELPYQLGEYLPAGTLIYSSVAVNYDYYSHIGVWASVDCGQSWTEISTVAVGAGDGFGVWEPVMFYDNGYLYCFYSDDTGDGITAPDQKIVYQRSKDGFTWEASVDVCSLSDYAARPGMPVITKMGNGEYFLVYEYVYENTDSYVYYKKTSDITSWNSSDMGSRISAKSGSKTYYPAAAPSCVWTPAGGTSGMLFATGQYQGGGVPYNCVFVSLDYGRTWNIMENPLPYSNYKYYEPNNLGGYRPIMVTGTDPSVIHYISMTTNTEVQYVTLRVNDAGNPNQGKNPLDYQKKVIFKVENGKWNDGTTEDKIFYVTLAKDGVWDISGSATISIPAVGSMPYNGYMAGKWSTTLTTTVSGTEDTTYTYVYSHASYENCTNAFGQILAPVFVNGITWELNDGNLKMPAGHENSFLLFNNPLVGNRIEATITIRDNLNGDDAHRNGIVFALTDHDGDLAFDYAGADVSYYWAFVNDWGCVEVIEMGKYQNWHWLSTKGVDLSALGIDITKGVTLAVEWDTSGHIKVYANEILVQDVTDTTPLTGNYYGLLVNKYGNYDPSYGAYDAPVTSFVAGELFVEFGGNIEFGGNVTLTGKTFADGAFTFELYKTGENFAESGTPIKTVKNTTGKFTFNVSYTTSDIGKTYYYVVKQANAGKTLNGITYSSDEYQITVKVESNGQGGVKTKVTVGNGVAVGALNFVNSYAVTGTAQVNLGGNVTLTGKTLADGMFTFELYNANSGFTTSGAPKTATNANGKFSFALSYTASEIGTHYYVLRQAKAGTTVSGITYSSASYKITVKVEDNGSGGLKATVSGVSANALNFANSYAVTEGTQVEIGGNVTLAGKTLTNDMFTFELYNANSSFTTSGTPKTATNANGKFAFKLSYTASEVGKTYYYVLRQADAGMVVNGVAHSSKTYQLTVKLQDNGQGAVEATVTVNGGVSSNALDFENTIKYSITTDAEGNLLTPHFINGVYWTEENGVLKPVAGSYFNFLLFDDTLKTNRVEATFIINDNQGGWDKDHRNGIVFAFTDHDGDLKTIDAVWDATDISYYWAFINDAGCVEVIEMGKYQNWHWLSPPDPDQAFDLATLGIDVTKGVTLAAEWDANGHIKVYANGILVLDVIDSTPLTGNYYGIYRFHWNNRPDTSITSFVAGKKQATITVTTENGTVEGAGKYELGESVTLTATPGEGYVFEGWYENGELYSSDITITFTVEADRELTAKFEKISYTVGITVTPDGSGTVTGAGSYKHGENVTLTATANKGYVFVGWYENGELVSAEATITFTAEANRELTAQFAPEVVYGDANGDGTLNEDDVALIREYIARFNYDANTSSVNVEAEADFNCDGQINMKDIILIRQYIANNG